MSSGNGKSPVRWQKVLELRAKLNGMQGLNFREKYFVVFDEVDSIDQGYSKKELALGLYPDMVKPNDSKQPSDRAVRYIDVHKREYNKCLENKHHVLYPQKTSKGDWIIHNMMSKGEFKKVVRLDKNAMNGIESMIRNAVSRLNLTAKQRREINDKLRAEIQLEIKRRKKMEQ